MLLKDKGGQVNTLPYSAQYLVHNRCSKSVNERKLIEYRKISMSSGRTTFLPWSHWHMSVATGGLQDSMEGKN